MEEDEVEEGSEEGDDNESFADVDDLEGACSLISCGGCPNA